jgi:diaminopimelate decarboxylase
MLELFPESASVEDGELAIGGVLVSRLAADFGTPLVVYCERTIRAQARAYRAVDPDALVVYGTKAFPNVALLRLLAEEGLGADVSTLGELEFALRAAVPGERIVFHGNNKSDDELRAAARVGALVVLDAVDEVERAAAAAVRRVLVRVTPGIEAETHQSIQTAHSESKFGLAPDDALAAVRAGLAAGLDVAGFHVHIGSQLARVDESLVAIDRLTELAGRGREELGWSPRVFDVGGGAAIRHSRDEHVPEASDFARALVERLRSAWPGEAQLVLEPGRSLVGRAAISVYRIGVVKQTPAVTYVAVDGGMSDNPRPQLYATRYEALLANRAGEPAGGEYRIAGKHCESGDVLIDRIELPSPRRGDLLAVPATGAYTLAMSSNYNGVPRPAAVLVAADGEVRLIRRRETLDDLLAFEV